MSTEQNPPTITWDHGWPARLMRRPPGQLLFPDERAAGYAPEIPSSGLEIHILVAERSGGFTQFEKWLRGRFTGLPRALDFKWKSGAENDLEAWGQGKGEAASWPDLLTRSGGMLLMRNAEDTEHFVELVSQIRGEKDQETARGLLLIAVREVEVLKTDHHYSSLLAVSSVYRFAWWTIEDVLNTWLGTLERGPLDARLVYEATGGQPLLTSRYVEQLMSETGDLERKTYRRVENHIINHPAAAVEEGRKPQLAKLMADPALGARGYLRGEVAYFASGQRKHRLDRKHEPLVFAGWLTQYAKSPADTTGPWFMPRCHQAWAREVLDETR